MQRSSITDIVLSRADTDPGSSPTVSSQALSTETQEHGVAPTDVIKSAGISAQSPIQRVIDRQSTYSPKDTPLESETGVLPAQKILKKNKLLRRSNISDMILSESDTASRLSSTASGKAFPTDTQEHGAAQSEVTKPNGISTQSPVQRAIDRQSVYSSKDAPSERASSVLPSKKILKKNKPLQRSSITGHRTV